MKQIGRTIGAMANMSADITPAAANKVLLAAKDLASQADRLTLESRRFVDSVRAA